MTRRPDRAGRPSRAPRRWRAEQAETEQGGEQQQERIERDASRDPSQPRVGRPGRHLRRGRQRPLDPAQQRHEDEPGHRGEVGGQPGQLDRAAGDVTDAQQGQHADEGGQHGEHPTGPGRLSRGGEQRNAQRAVPGRRLVGGVHRHRHGDVGAEHRRRGQAQLHEPDQREQPPAAGCAAAARAGPAARRRPGSARGRSGHRSDATRAVRLSRVASSSHRAQSTQVAR